MEGGGLCHLRLVAGVEDEAPEVGAQRGGAALSAVLLRCRAVLHRNHCRGVGGGGRERFQCARLSGANCLM